MKHLLIFLAMLLIALSHSAAQEQSKSDPLIGDIVSLVIAHNPTLQSFQRSIRESSEVQVPGDGLSVPGVSFDTGLTFLNPFSGSFSVAPSVSIGLSLSFGDPARSLDILQLKQEKEKALREYESAKNEILAELFSKIRDISTIRARQRNLTQLRQYLEDYSSAAEAQRIAQSIAPDKLWDLKERIIDLRIELESMTAGLDSTLRETAMQFGGDAWEDLLGLLGRLIEAA
jgi:hypothetical protein